MANMEEKIPVFGPGMRNNGTGKKFSKSKMFSKMGRVSDGGKNLPSKPSGPVKNPTQPSKPSKPGKTPAKPKKP